MANKSESKKYHFIYKTTCLINGKYYIGMHSTNNLEDGYLGSGKYLWYSIKKHGKENFKIEILEYCENREDLIVREKEIITEELIQDSLCMNLKLGGHGGFLHEIQIKGSPAAGKKHADRLLNDLQYNLRCRKSLSEGVKKAYREGKKMGFTKGNTIWKNRKHTEETKLKQSLAKKGKKLGKENSQYGTCWITNGIKSKKIKKGSIIPKKWKLGRIVKPAKGNEKKF